MSAYLGFDYAKSFTEYGNPFQLPECNGWLIERAIPGFPDRDAMGCYPLFSCHDWSRLSGDLEDLTGRLVSVALVTDPFGNYDRSNLERCFDRVIAFKEHLVADLHLPMTSVVSADHRYHARRALKDMSVELCRNPLEHLDEWTELYGNLVQRHQIHGMLRFSRESFARQFTAPGFLMFRALREGKVVGAQTLFIHGDVAYGHLMAMSEEGYRLRAANALTWNTLNYLRDKVRWVDIGAVAGTKGGDSNGLLQWKRGWATGTRTAYFCARILDRDRYSQIVNAKGIGKTEYFPAYRMGEFQ